ncbi:polyprenol monophosphomannose synthase [Leeia sp.]|uniref:polyprenol monophosphomannose synthase n=1 Tax=Leeia sp. TaxID=2884678 RepID=UPI0035AF09DB
MNNIAVVIPAYRESENIVQLCQEILARYSKSNILIVDDSPDDLTEDAIKKLAHPRIKIMHRKNKGGRGSAVIDGIRSCIKEGYDFYLEIDADFSHPPEQISSLVAQADREKLDLLIASRYLSGSKILNWPLSRKIFSRCANLLARALLQVPVNDYTNGFRLYSKEAAQEVVNTSGKLGGGFIALSEILVNLYYRNYKIGEVSTVFKNRIRGESSLSRREVWNALVGLKRIYQLKKQLSK